MPHGHRVQRAAALMNDAPGRFWPMVEALKVYWGIHPCSVLGEPLRADLARSWAATLEGPWERNGLRFVGILRGEFRLPAVLCVSRLAEVSILGSWEVAGWPRRVPRDSGRGVEIIVVCKTSPGKAGGFGM